MTARSGVAVLLALILLSQACATKPAPRKSGAERHASFTCELGETVEVIFFLTREKALLLYDGHSFELWQEPAASGFLYTNGAISIQGKGSELLLGMGGQTPVRCDED